MSKATESKAKEIKIGTGFLHLSVNKTNEKSPDFFGVINIGGNNFDLGGWRKDTEKGGQFISINADESGLSDEDKQTQRKGYLEEFKVKRSDKANDGKYILMNFTGSMHRAKEDAKEDFFGSLKMNEETIYFKAFSMEIKNKPVLMLKISDGLASKEERNAITNEFL